MTLRHTTRATLPSTKAAGFIVAFALTLSSPASSQTYLSEATAHAAAVEILMGNPYGDSVTEVSRNIRRSSLVVGGSKPCAGAISTPVWSFDVHIEPARHGEPVIEGTLDVDAVSGELVCANLPFLS